MPDRNHPYVPDPANIPDSMRSAKHEPLEGYRARFFEIAGVSAGSPEEEFGTEESRVDAALRGLQRGFMRSAALARC